MMAFPVSMDNFQFPSDFLTVVVSSLTDGIRTGKNVSPNNILKKYCQYHCHGDRTCYKDKDESTKHEVWDSHVT